MSYRRDYLRSDHWRTKRTEAFVWRGQKCELCGITENLDVHHLSYKRLFGETVEHLRVLCRKCHDEVHKLLRKYPGLKSQHPAKQWFIVWSHIRKTKPPPSAQSHMNRFGLCRGVLVWMRLVKRKRMPWRDELLKRKVCYSVPLKALSQYMRITRLDPRYRQDRVGAQKLLTFK